MRYSGKGHCLRTLLLTLPMGLPALGGCQSLPESGPNRFTIKEDIAWRERERQQLKERATPYLGQSAEVVRSKFGEPDKVFSGDYGDADERWDYIIRFHRRRIGIENFFFKQGKLVRVDFF